MSEFWKYFHDRLAWPLIHAPGPLSGLVRGMALALDSARDDIVYFRRQWFPELCEAETEAFSRLLGVHVQRLATLAQGDHVCTTFVPTPSSTADPTTRERRSR